MLTIKKLFHHLGPTLPVGIGNTIFKTNQEALLSKENIFRNMMLSNWPCFTWKFFLITFHKILKLIFQKQPSCPRNICTNNRRELSNLTAFLEIFLYLKNSDSLKHVWKVLSIVPCIKVQIFEVFECSGQNSSVNYT